MGAGDGINEYLRAIYNTSPKKTRWENAGHGFCLTLKAHFYIWKSIFVFYVYQLHQRLLKCIDIF